MRDVAGGLDSRVGNLIETVERRHHARRLARNGWSRALATDGGAWVTGSFPPRDGNDIEVHLRDGGRYSPAPGCR